MDIIFPVGIKDISFVSKHATKLESYTKLSAIPSYNLFNQLNDKWEFSQLMNHYQISHPKTYSFNNCLDNIEYPILIKPKIGTGGLHIIKINSSIELENYIKSNLNNLENCFVQEYIKGYDVDISVACKDGEIITYTIQKNATTKRNNFGPPKSTRFIYNKDVLEVATKMLKSIGFNGIAHIDMRIDSTTEEVYVIEINPRYWASLFGSLTAGINFPQIALQSALNEPVNNKKYQEITFSRLTYWMKKFYKKDVRLKHTNLKFLLKDLEPILRRKINRLTKKRQ